MTKQVRINTATGEVTGSRVHPAPAQEPAVWYDEQHDAEPAFDAETQVVEQDNKLVGEEYVYGYIVRSLNAQELADIVTNKWAGVRGKRDNLLSSSDFTQLGDSPKDKQPWMDYRQALRDVTNVETPDDVIWPTEPGV